MDPNLPFGPLIQIHHKMAISQNAILAKFQSPKSLIPLHFSMNLPETFKIDVNMDFANNLGSVILLYSLYLQKIVSPKS